MEITEDIEENELSVGERFYMKHKERVSKYQKNNPEKMRLKCKKYNEKFREERPDEYILLLEKKRLYYKMVTKPKIEALKIAIK
jgi:hypothetical protein